MTEAHKAVPVVDVLTSTAEHGSRAMLYSKKASLPRKRKRKRM